jgi:hypothetical protein
MDKGESMITGIDLIVQERTEQITKHNWTPKHDDEHASSELAIEASHLALQQTNCVVFNATFNREEYEQFGLITKLSGQRIHQLKVAGALIAAEIDRLLRSGLIDE